VFCTVTVKSASVPCVTPPKFKGLGVSVRMAMVATPVPVTTAV